MYSCILNILLLIRAIALEFFLSLLMNLLISLGICSAPKLSKQTVYFGLTNKETQCVSVFSHSSKFITYAPFLILFGKLLLEYTPLNLDSFL